MRRRTVWLGVAVVAAGAGVAAFLLLGGDAAPCAGVTAQLEETWNESRRTELRKAYGHIEIAYAADAWKRADASFDSYVRRWESERLDACAATHVRGEQPEANRVARVECLERARVRVDSLLHALAKPDADAVAAAPIVARSLPPLERCRVATPTPGGLEPTSEGDADLVESIERELAKTRARIDVSTNAAALDEAKRHQRHAMTDGTARHQADASVLLARLHARQGDWAATSAALDEAAKLAGRDRIATLQLEIGLLRAEVALAQGEVGAARRAVGLATSAMQRGSLGPWRGWQAKDADARVLSAEHDLEGAVEVAKSARDAAQAQFGFEHPTTASLDVALGDRLVEQGEHDKAKAAYDYARDRYIAVLGDEHPAVAGVKLRQGVLLRVRGDHPAALEAIETALDGLQASLGPRHPRSADAIAELARTHAAAGGASEATRLLSNALALRKLMLGESHPLVAQTQAELDAVSAPPPGDPNPP